MFSCVTIFASVPHQLLPAWILDSGDGRPAPPSPVKMIKTAGKLWGKIKARISTFSNRGNKWWNNITTLSNAQSSLSIGYARESKKWKYLLLFFLTGHQTLLSKICQHMKQLLHVQNIIRRFWPLPRPAPHCREGGLAMASHPYDDEKMIQRQGRLLLFWKITKASKIMMMKVWINNEDVYYYDDQLDRGEEWLLEAINV